MVLRWTTLSEKNTTVFEVQRAASDVRHSEFRIRNWQTVATVEAQGTSAEAHTYTFRAEGFDYGDYNFRLKQVDRDGSAAYSKSVDVSVTLAIAYALSKAYPNPFARIATLELAVREAQRVRVELHNVLGQRVAVIYDAEVPASETTEVRIDGGPPGQRDVLCAHRRRDVCSDSAAGHCAMMCSSVEVFKC